MVKRTGLYCRTESVLSVIVTVSVVFALFSFAFFPYPVLAQEDSEAVQGEGSNEEVIDIVADELSYDRKSGLATAKGNVEISFKSYRITGNYAEYDESGAVVVITGRARFEDTEERSVLVADRIVVSLETGEMEAESGVFLRHKDGEVLASGDRLSYLGDDGRVIIDGNASVEIGDKIFQASSITVYIDEERVVAEGGTRTVIPRGQ